MTGRSPDARDPSLLDRRPTGLSRRALLGTLSTGLGAALAGCSGSRVEGVVASNGAPLALTHEYSTKATPSGTRVLVEVTAENDGDAPLTPDGRVPEIVCTFLNDAGETLHESGQQLVQPLAVGESTALEFSLAVDTEDVTRYELRSEWVEA